MEEKVLQTLGISFVPIGRQRISLANLIDRDGIAASELNQALAVLNPYCRPEWRVAGFRDRLEARGESGHERVG